jgi:predicted enzyme related to lactoylglutathione lyase
MVVRNGGTKWWYEMVVRNGGTKKNFIMKRVTGIGGIFFKARNPKTLQAWYVKHLGLPVTPDGYVVFSQQEKGESHTVWSTFSQDTTYFTPGDQSFMVNFRVADLDQLLKQLQQEGVEVVGEVEEYDYGKFGWILDPEGNKIELWEPNDPRFREVNKI